MLRKMKKSWKKLVKIASRPVRALWIEIDTGTAEGAAAMSRPVRALWIEMPELRQQGDGESVEAREGLVD